MVRKLYRNTEPTVPLLDDRRDIGTFESLNLFVWCPVIQSS